MFKPGDVVTLKSGGPRMTINWVDETGVICLWFPENLKGQCASLCFHVDTLVRVGATVNFEGVGTSWVNCVRPGE